MTQLPALLTDSFLSPAVRPHLIQSSATGLKKLEYYAPCFPPYVQIRFSVQNAKSPATKRLCTESA
jgi:hypothetical protein